MPNGVRLSPVTAYQHCGLGYTPNPMQEEMYRSITSGDCTVLLKAPTGSGKTEAVLVPALLEQRRIVLIYPALSLIEDQEMRIERMLQHLSVVMPNQQRTLIVDTGADMYRRTWLNGKEQHRERRHLYHGDVILTTLDKFLYRFFGFGEPKKSYIYPLRLRYGRRPLFCFDEAHSYDEVAYTNFVDLVRAIGFNADAPRDVVVMTATMPTEYERDLLLSMLTPIDYLSGDRAAALAYHYATVSPRSFPNKAFKYVSVPVHNREVFCQQLLKIIEEQHRPGLRSIVTVEEVGTAVALYRDLVKSMKQDVMLYHGRQTHSIRRDVYKMLRHLEDADQGYLLVTTSAIEVGCDLNAHLLLTQLCNPEQLVQRAGRCNRRGLMPAARIIVVGDRIPDYLCTLPEDNLEQYKSILQHIAKEGTFAADAFLQLQRRHSTPDYRVRTMFAMLYEYVYQAERANKALHDKGLVITRSWEPTLTLTTGWDSDDRPQNALQVSLLACSTRNIRELDDQCEVLVQYYDDYAEQYKREPPRYGGCAYHQDIVLRVPEAYFDPVTGYERLPKVFLHGGHQGYRHWLSYTVNKPQMTPSRKPARSTSTNAATDDTGASNMTREKIWWWYLERLPPGNEDIPAAKLSVEEDAQGREDSTEEDSQDE